MGTAYSYMDKEARRKLSLMPLMTAGVFNKHFNAYHEKIELSLSNEEEADNLRVRFADYFAERIILMGDNNGVKTGWRRRVCYHDERGYDERSITTICTPFGEELVNDYLALHQLVVRCIRKEKKKEEIKAAAEGKVAYDDLKQRFPMISVEGMGRSKVKVQLYRDLDDGGRPMMNKAKLFFYVWGHFEVVEKKDWYSVEEITACIKKIIDHAMNFHMDKIHKLNVANAFLEKLT